MHVSVHTSLRCVAGGFVQSLFMANSFMHNVSLQLAHSAAEMHSAARLHIVVQCVVRATAKLHAAVSCPLLT